MSFLLPTNEVCEDVFLSGGGGPLSGKGLCPGGLCLGRVSVQGGLCPRGVSVQGGSLSNSIVQFTIEFFVLHLPDCMPVVYESFIYLLDHLADNSQLLGAIIGSFEFSKISASEI